MLNRLSVPLPNVTVATAVASSEEILFKEFSGGCVYVPAGSSITTLTWYTASESGGTYLPASDEDGVAVTQTVAHTNAYAIPSALFGCACLKIKGNAAGTVDIVLKG